ncbi:MAG: FKBP-type peptidyl-prolyl cis-trans isomerase [Gemmatimonadetes bacterium]|nr:FKBP-type peptidyl-prolyl cis-trans isomerase [Gemmatimonadota bacterium]
MSFAFCRLNRITGLVALAATAACSDGGSPDPVSIENTQFAASLGINLSQFTRTSAGVYLQDVTVGNGAVATNGKRASIHYIGWLANGTQFDANQPPSQPFAFTIASGQVIPGFDEAVRDMKVGGRRKAIIPSELGYGRNGSGPIPPNAVLVFQIDLVALQ